MVRMRIMIPVALLALLTGCRERPKINESSFTAMGTGGSLAIAATHPDQVPYYASAVKGILEELEAEMSFHRDTSDLSRLNRSAGGTPVPVSGHMYRVLELSKSFGERSGGAFDVTVGPLVRLWGFAGGTPPEDPLSPAAVQGALGNVGYQHLVLSSNTAFLDKAGVQADLGGIAKGYAADVCAQALLDRGATNFLVNLGGNMKAVGRPPLHRYWKIGVRNPFDRDNILGVLRLRSGMAVATSGNYERFVTIHGKKYAHILNPRTGMPVEGMAAVTVLAPTAVEADALSTSLFVLGVEEGTRMLRGTPGGEALFVLDRQPIEIWMTPGFRAAFSPIRQISGRVFVIGQN